MIYVAALIARPRTGNRLRIPLFPPFEGSSLFSVEPYSGLESRSDGTRVAVDFSPRTRTGSGAVAERRLTPFVPFVESHVSSVAPRRKAVLRSSRGLKSTAIFTRSLRDRAVAISIPAIPASQLPSSFIPPKPARNPRSLSRVPRRSSCARDPARRENPESPRRPPPRGWRWYRSWGQRC
jgi:hypothetical protein